VTTEGKPDHHAAYVERGGCPGIASNAPTWCNERAATPHAQHWALLLLQGGGAIKMTWTDDDPYPTAQEHP
jgi:hypothetical protein